MLWTRQAYEVLLQIRLIKLNFTTQPYFISNTIMEMGIINTGRIFIIDVEMI